MKKRILMDLDEKFVKVWGVRLSKLGALLRAEIGY